MSTATSAGHLGSAPDDAAPAWPDGTQRPPEGDRGPVPGPDTPARTTDGPRIPLRITLVALLVALVAAALTLTGVSATSLLRGYLLDQHDDRDERDPQWGPGDHVRGMRIT